ncbi:GNAT family N-acetyltransferase [Montanilutibacter psychrotolerans]|uniref:GNAT family N-acetyltransferase n=1 Tax=Montanilutibacter psychrotolerans TaxID=1327343 RepID=A0A3M8T0L3_9GAMM|nr:GNAT family N-acetyltransferase [Lysobacter psychrotolerans]RNF86563.1 GNAT family N-acetyltransferase [Lysobacter psychrotolerans]
MAPTSLAFPAHRDDGIATPASLTGRGIALRHAQSSDLPYLRELYASTREQELAQVAWPPQARQAFLDSQFALQHLHYVNHFPQAAFLVIEQHGDPVGRYYLQRGDASRAHHDEVPGDDLLIDISLGPAVRGQGLATALIGDSQRQAARHGRGMQLHVQCDNTGAARLYQRLGFSVVADEGAYQRLRWDPRG